MAIALCAMLPGANDVMAIFYFGPVGEPQDDHVHVRDGVNEDQVAMREARDPKLAAPLLLMSWILANICTGKLPLRRGGLCVHRPSVGCARRTNGDQGLRQELPGSGLIAARVDAH